MRYHSGSGRGVLRGRLGVPRAGGVLLVAVVALVALLACAALTIDVGRVMMVGSHCQSLADATALAGAGGPINTSTDSLYTRVQQIFEVNSVASLPATLNTDAFVFYNNGATVPGYGALGADEEAITTSVSATAEYTFGRAIGLNSKTVTRTATALRKANYTGGTVLFSLSPSASDIGINFSGNRATVYGTSHSNSRYDISGNNHHFTEVLEWVSKLRVTGSKTVMDDGDRQTGVLPAPVTFTVAQFAPFDYEISGDYNSSSGYVAPGVYRVHGNVHVSGANTRMYGVTFVADGTITFAGSGHHYTPARLHMFAFSLSNCANGAISVSSDGQDCVGGLYAPNGNIDFSGSDQSYAQTSIIGRTIDISGSDCTIVPTPNFGEEAHPIRLIK